jgi:acetoacetate decarboxylase
VPGFTRPFTPGGKASAIPALPWQFAGDLLLVHFRADPDALNALLPPPLEPPASPGEAFLWSPHLRCHPADTASEDMNPGRTHYNVAVIGIPCRFQGKPTMFSAFQWGDRDWLVTVSWFLGACSKLAQFDQTGRHPMFPVTAGAVGVGSPLVRTVSRHGEKILQIGFRPEREVALAELDFYTSNLPLTCMRHMPDVEVPPRNKPRLHDLTQMAMTDTQFGQATAGKADLRFFDADNEELLPIQPTKVLGGYWIPMSFLLHGVRVVHDYLEE